jgi:hypothetical protein
MKKYTGELLVILIAMRMQRYNVGRITQWSTSQASLDATVCRNQVSACTVLPWHPPRSSILNEKQKH